MRGAALLFAGRGRNGDPGVPGTNPRGVWSVAAAYATRDLVTFAGASYIAVADQAAGGAAPAGNANWLKIAAGGEIGYVERGDMFGTLLTPQATLVDVIPGLVVPANAGAIMLHGKVGMVNIKQAATAVVGDLVAVRFYIVDDQGIVCAAWQENVVAAVAGAKSNWKQPKLSGRVPNQAAQRTYKLQGFVDSLNAGKETVEMWSGPGRQTVGNTQGNFDFGPAFIQAVAL